LPSVHRHYHHFVTAARNALCGCELADLPKPTRSPGLC
jgi:hypothetical protein